MFKNFSIWSSLKTCLNNEKGVIKEFKVGEIWWCHIGLNIGSEEDGTKSFSSKRLIRNITIVGKSRTKNIKKAPRFPRGAF